MDVPILVGGGSSIEYDEKPNTARSLLAGFWACVGLRKCGKKNQNVSGRLGCPHGV